MQHILVCDDEEDIVAALKIYLEADGYCVHAAYTGADALKIVREEPVQLALMDIMMPGMDGITAMAKLREFSNIPVILLTAKSEDSDKILGLSVGADDYITKPFNPVEVLARVKSQLRRFLQLGAAVKAPSVISVGGIELDHDAKRVTLDGEPVALTPKEYDILYYLMQHPGKVYIALAQHLINGVTAQDGDIQLGGYAYRRHQQTAHHKNAVRAYLVQHPAQGGPALLRGQLVFCFCTHASASPFLNWLS